MPHTVRSPASRGITAAVGHELFRLLEFVVLEYTDFGPARAQDLCPAVGSFKGLKMDTIKAREKKGFS